MRHTTWLWALVLLAGGAAGQDEAPPNGPRRIDPGWHALTNATVYVAPDRTLAGATVVLKGDRIVKVSQDPPPAGARVWDCTGCRVFAGFLDLHVPAEAAGPKPRHWNKKVRPERIAAAVDDATAKDLRELGFTAGVAAPKSGIFRGRASLVSLAPHDPDLSVPRPAVHATGVYQAIGFERFGRSDDGFPTSLMGAIAVVRQGLHDGLAPDQTLLFETQDELDALRAAKIAKEFGRRALLLGSGLEFKRLHAIAAAELPVVAPLRLPPEPDVASLDALQNADLRELMTWEQAPTNLRRLDRAGVVVALTASRLKKTREFWPNLRKIVATAGLGESRALAMLTTNPANILGVADRFGTVEAGKRAHLVVADGPLFEEHTNLRAVWIDGTRHEITPRDAGGQWRLAAAPPLFGERTLVVGRRARLVLKEGEKRDRIRHGAVRGERIHFAFEADGKLFTLSGAIRAGTMRGHGVGPEGARFTWTAERTGPAPERKEPELEAAPVPEVYGYPFGPYALAEPPEQEALILRGATVWTCGPDGVIEDGEVEIRGGKITYVGPRRRLDAAVPVLDGKGKHVTPGIVDCHSHTGIARGVNDSGQAVTAEVRIGDVTDPDSISWYRQLAGGVTTVNSLHGSANPIGGQSQTNKIRWGARHSDGMHFEGAPPGIKFALGENVKQSNWGDDYTKRYPQTRMGVETLIRDRFLAAREYLKGHDKVDLELEALGEILQGTRLIHCHSYRQDEILMLCRIAEEFGFKIGTFQHVLEGYKVADAIAKHALGGSAFSDWWAYKVEVQDAIPFNGALMRAVGVTVSFNSDSDELARRLNLEAAKAVKYGGVSPAEALKFVTLNPAIQLGIEARVGSLEKGKDADLALWSGDPLSTYTICEATWVDGRRYFSLEQDRKHREHIRAERARILRSIHRTAQRRKKPDDDDEEDETDPVWWVRKFKAARAGECGCFERGAR